MPKRILTVEAINDRLADTGIRLYLRGKKLYLRATLPRKDGQLGDRQQWVSLGLGLTPIELEHAEAKAWQLHAQRVMGKFRWEDWTPLISPVSKKLPCSEWVERYRRHKLAQGLLPSSWERGDGWYLKRLPPNRQPEEEMFIEIALQTKPNTRDRKAICGALSRLACFIGIDCDLSPYRGDYSHRKVKPRRLPTDEQIVEIRETIFTGEINRRTAYHWQWVYGVMAAYGLRNHEVFYCQIEKSHPYACRISEGKTGDRIAYPLYPEWVERWQLFDMRVPVLPRLKEPIESKSHVYLGHRVGNALLRYLVKLPKEKRHKPYDLRHCYALRGSVRFGIAPRVMASLMGHSVDVHLSIYSRWLSQFDSEKIYLEGMLRSDRPLAP